MLGEEVASGSLQSLAGHLQVVVALGLWELGEVHQTRVLTLVVIPNLQSEERKRSSLKSHFRVYVQKVLTLMLSISA